MEQVINAKFALFFHGWRTVKLLTPALDYDDLSVAALAAKNELDKQPPSKREAVHFP
jgi:hypothetical protein